MYQEYQELSFVRLMPDTSLSKIFQWSDVCERHHTL